MAGRAVGDAGDPGRQRLIALLTKLCASCPDVMRAVLAGLGDHVGGGPVADDWTLIVLKRLPPSATPAIE
jgi:hypothetical protein